VTAAQPTSAASNTDMVFRANGSNRRRGRTASSAALAPRTTSVTAIGAMTAATGHENSAVEKILVSACAGFTTPPPRSNRATFIALG
jgi:hypothetical protein